MKLPEYDTADAMELARWVRDGEVSAGELLEAAIQRIDTRNPEINAVILKHYDRAGIACHNCQTDRLPAYPSS